MAFVDSICIKILNPELLIYGKGNKLILRTKSREIVNKTQTYDKIHRISFKSTANGAYLIACAAGREILTAKVSENKFEGESFVCRLSDWISSIKYLDNGTIAVITSHNFALWLHVGENDVVVKEKLRNEDNSTLYCSHIHGNSWENLIFFAGTALGELIIWTGAKSTLFKKSLHNGVIFCIDYSGDYLITGSDDRSMKIFRVNETLQQVTNINKLFGHTSRVFVCKIIKYQDCTKFVSAGEDSNVCIWHENGNLQSKHNVSASGIIWNMDYDTENAILVTCSSTGKLNRFQLNKLLHTNSYKENFPEKIDPAKLKYLQNGTLCVLDTKMQIHSKSFEADEWIKIEQPQSTHKIVAMEVYENRLFLAAKSSILIFDYNIHTRKLNFTLAVNVEEKFSLPEKLNYFRALHALSVEEVFVSDASGHCIIFDLQHVTIKNLFQLPKSSEPWSTAVAKTNKSFYLVGDRMGRIYLFKNDYDENQFLPHTFKLSKLHGPMGVTMITVLDNDFIQTSGYDGTIKTLFLNAEKSQLELYHTERTVVNWIEKVKMFNDREYVLGFNDNYFVVYRSNTIIYEHKCGGRHRHWDVSLITDRDASKMRFAFIQKKQLNCVEFYLNDFSFDIDDDLLWHTKECNAIRMIDDVKILISGSEDTCLKLMRIGAIKSANDVRFEKIANINSHISSIKAITAWQEADNLWIVSVGGRGQIVVTRIVEMKFIKEEINFMQNGESQEVTYDTETRFTCTHFDLSQRRLFVGCSDGYLRVFQLVKRDFSTSLQLLIESFYNRCILHVAVVQSFVLTMATDGIVCFWHFDDKSLELNVTNKLKHNKNGINCFDIIPLSNGENFYRIVTSGDDCGIYITDFQITENNVIFGATIKSYDVHIAQVTGVKFLSQHTLLSASIDQRVCKLRIDKDRVAIVDKRTTCVSDVKGFSLYDGAYIFVFGAGLEVMELF